MINEWTIVVVLSAVVGLFVTVGKPILKAVEQMKEANMEIKQLQVEMVDMKKDIKDMFKQLADHELRIHDLEQEAEE